MPHHRFADATQVSLSKSNRKNLEDMWNKNQEHPLTLTLPRVTEDDDVFVMLKVPPPHKQSGRGVFLGMSLSFTAHAQNAHVRISWGDLEPLSQKRMYTWKLL